MKLGKLGDRAAFEGDVLRVSEATYRGPYSTVTRSLVGVLGDRPLGEVTPADVDRWQRSLDGLATSTINSYRSAARAMFNRVGRPDLAGVIRILPPPRPASKAMRPEHLDAMLLQANVRDAAILLVLRDSGRRRASIPQLGVDDTRIWQGPDGRFRLASRVVEKGLRPQLVFARHDAALATSLWLSMRPWRSRWVFSRLTGPEQLSVESVSSIFRRLREAAGIPGGVNASPHGLRHTFAQRQLEEHDARVVADWMGISVETLLEVYATRSADDLQRLFFGDGVGY